jgi:hypothetical protein
MQLVDRIDRLLSADPPNGMRGSPEAEIMPYKLSASCTRP